ncbi:TonB dependent receptor [Polaribacter sp. KT25b]|uniref:TonB-dependent receptor n=1 Tax=Polaribacter sp. KT25b TaxID=1855336 RepID=UPI00087BA4B1|nr:TonB-dependent receptor [Polaribacter sp. KT25b]SDR72464.1 TonB dependent receptor [Polaribacter sp. KT25b]
MKKGFFIFLSLFGILTISAQKKSTEKENTVKIDTVKTEVVEVETKYNPKIADATKIKKNPTLKLLDKSKKKKLNYNIFSAPVASTFIPKTGVVKGVDVGVKERIYDNYIAAGFGNYTSPYLEASINSSTRFENEFGFYTKYAASLADIDNTVLDSNFSNFLASAFYKKEERYFDWKVSLNSERNQYNWYGLPNSNFTQNTVDLINEKQTYNYFNIVGEVDFLDAYLDKSSISIGYFSDAFNSNEILVNINTHLELPLDMIYNQLDNLDIKAGLELLNGKFEKNYTTENELKYSIFTVKLNPEYKTTFSGFSLKIGAKIFGSFDTENSVNNFLVYPDLHIQKPIIEEYLNIYGGVSGDLKTNTYKEFSEENPYLSPTLFITQTSEKYNAFIGLNGNFNNDISFNISASLKAEDDKPLFLRNNSKSDGTNTSLNGVDLKGYEYGNSYNVVYDDIKTTSIFAEIEYDFTKRMTFATNIQFDDFSMTNQAKAWNLPTFQTSFIAKYKTNKWYATSNIFYINERQDLIYSATYPSSTSGFQTLSSYVDVNLNGGYHFNDKFSVFLKLNNVLNNNYQRFANFDVQGFQALGGVTYKFDF